MGKTYFGVTMNNTKHHDMLIGSLCAIGCETLYGLSYIFTKQATVCASEFALLGWRFFIAVIVMSLCILFGFIKIDLKGKNKKPLLLVAFCNPCIYFLTETIGISNTTASESGIFLACIPVASLIFSTILLKKRPSKIQMIGILITLLGVIVTVFAVGASSSLSVPGYTFLFGAVVSYALYSVFVDKAFEYTGAEITYVMLIAGAFLFILLAVAEAMIQGSLDELLLLPIKERDFLSAILYQGMGCSVVAFLLSNIAISKIGVNRTSSFIGISTVVSILAGVLLLKETLTIYQIAGAVTIIVGVYVANARHHSEI